MTSPSEGGWTRGPWTAHETIPTHNGFPACWQIDAEYDAVCTTQFCYARETEANARLIAAAPSLVEALKPFAMAFACFDADRWDDETRISIELPTTQRARPVTSVCVEDIKRLRQALTDAGVAL